jgi:hypothetical protein
MGLCAVVSAGLAARFPGLGRGLALGEGGDLTLAGAGRLVELAAKALVLGLQVANPSLKGLAVGTPDQFHVDIMRRSGTRSHADGTQEWFSLRLGR